jgi:ribosomal protein S18 acetylase RimI-like enzyme
MVKVDFKKKQKHLYQQSAKEVVLADVPTMRLTVRASIEDAASILELQKRSYHSEAEIYDDFAIPPLLQTLDDLKIEFTTKTVLKAVLNEQLVGSVRAWERSGTCYIERLIVHPEFQDHGIGTKLMHDIENCFSETRRFELFTGHKSERNISLYRKLGYQVFAHQRINDNLSFTYMEKLK